MYSLNIVWLAIFITIATAIDDQGRLFSWSTNSEQASQTKHQYQIESNNGNQNYNNQNTSRNTYAINDVIESILASNVQGRNLNGFDEVYSDPTVQDALQKGDNKQTRNIIKDRLCTLGLAQCDNSDDVDHKNAFLSPGEAIYAQPPYRESFNGPIKPPTRIVYGAPRPIPPGIINGNRFGPRKSFFFQTNFSIH